MLRRAVFISIVCHFAVLVSFWHVAQFAEPAFHAENAVIDARLLSPTSGTPSPLTVPLHNTPLPPAKVLATAAETVPKFRAGRESPVLPSLSRSTATAGVAVSDRAAVVSVESALPSSTAALPKDEVSPDGVRQYRLNLAREARRFKRYPPLARQRGWEGVVVVVVNTVVGGALPQVDLSQSSGFDLLDQEALELVLQAVHTATVPESLRNRQFGLTLPIHYRLDD